MPSMPRVIVDTNLLVRMVAGAPAASPLHRLWRAGQFELLSTPYLMNELANVLDRPHLQRYLQPGAARAFLTLLRAEATMISPTVHVSLCRDPKDDALLDAAIAGHADYVVTADRDLTDDLYLKETFKAKHGVRIVTMAEFLAALEKLS